MLVLLLRDQVNVGRRLRVGERVNANFISRVDLTNNSNPIDPDIHKEIISVNIKYRF